MGRESARQEASKFSRHAAEPIPRRRLLGATGAAVLLGAGCSPPPPLRIGFLGSLSGRSSDLGLGSREGAQLAIEDANAAGGLGGRHLELLVRDDEQNADVGRQRLSELYGLGVSFVIGPVTSTMAQHVIPLANERRIPLISPLAGANEFSGKDDAFFRVVSDTASSARQQAGALLVRGLRRLVTVADARNPVFTRSWVQSAGGRFSEGGGAIVEKLEFEGTLGLKFVELAQRIVAAEGDAVVIVANAADSAVLAQQIRRLRPNLFIALSAWAGSEEFPTLGGPALDGVLVTQFFDRFNAKPRWLEFVARYQARFGKAPGYTAMNGYDALDLGVAASRAAGRDGLLAALKQIREMDGLQRKLRFDEFGDCVVPTYLTEVRQGQYVAVPS